MNQPNILILHCDQLRQDCLGFNGNADVRTPNLDRLAADSVNYENHYTVYPICNMASSITGMICDGGNQGCVMKGIAAVGVAYASVEMALKQVSVQSVHGINGRTPEDTMRYMGQIASPGMVGTEATIMDILREKQEKASGE